MANILFLCNWCVYASISIPGYWYTLVFLTVNALTQIIYVYTSSRIFYSQIWIQFVWPASLLSARHFCHSCGSKQHFSQKLVVLGLVWNLLTIYRCKLVTNNITCKAFYMTCIVSPIANISHIHQSCGIL